MTLTIDPTRHHADGCYSEHAAWGPDGTLIVAIGFSDPPARGKYAPGDRVIMHGCSGAAPGNQRWGFRGIVLGGSGGGYYYGITDDGRQWFETGGSLLPDGAPSRDSCTCCPPKPRKPVSEPAGTQLDLFSPAELLATRTAA